MSGKNNGDALAQNKFCLKSVLNGLTAHRNGPDPANPDLLEVVAGVAEMPDKILSGMLKKWASDYLQEFGGEKYSSIVEKLKG